MNRTKTLLYGIVPLALTVPMVLMYFSGIDALQHIVSPRIEGIYGNSNRELGLLEGLQNFILLAILVMLLRSVMSLKRNAARAAAALFTVFVAFVLLEEMDYGLHYYEFLAGVPADQAAQDRNWHNVGDRTSQSKRLVDIGSVCAFLLAPFALARVRQPLLKTLTPDKYAALGIVAMFLTRSLAHGLKGAGFGNPGTMDSNLSEFRELITYYLWAVYTFDLLERRLRGKPGIGDME